MTNLLSKMHPSWLEASQHAELVQILLDQDAENPFLDRFLHEEYGLSMDDESLEPGEPMSVDSLIELIRLSGLVMNYKKIKALLSGDLQQTIVGLVGESYYHFSLNRGPFLSKTPLDDLAPSYDAWDSLVGVEDLLIHSGLRCLSLALNSEGPEITRRVLLRLPYRYSYILQTDEDFASLDTQENQLRARSLVMKIGKEVSACRLFSA